MDNRRHFLARSTWMLAGGTVWGNRPQRVEASQELVGLGDSSIRVGLIGCGRRGTRAAMEALSTQGPVKLVAMGDWFADNLQRSFRTINGKHCDQVDVRDRRYVGEDAYQRVLACDLDVVILAAPPLFRPAHFRAAVDERKHIFMERPLAIDDVGVRSIASTGQLAAQHRLSVAVGFQRRYDPKFTGALELIQQGLIGAPTSSEVFRHFEPSRRPVRRRQSVRDNQLFHWRDYRWTSGHSYLESHVEDIDVIQWWMGRPPTSIQSIHDGVLFHFDQVPARHRFHTGQEVTAPTSFRLHGSRGTCDLLKGMITDQDQRVVWRYRGAPGGRRSWQRQQDQFFAHLREGKRTDDLPFATNSTMAGILGCKHIGHDDRVEL
ncbi:MAG: Gfo/Idh/MocA family oxidoreductase [Planctomycetota bacterium]